MKFSKDHDLPFYSNKTMDTIGNCQRPVFSLCGSQHKHKITKPVQLGAQSVIKVGR